MEFDFISFLLVVIIVVIIAAIFTLLRSINAPFIKKFEKFVKSEVVPLRGVSSSYVLNFRFGGRKFALYEIRHRSKHQQNRGKKKYIFLKILTTHEFLIYFQNTFDDTPMDNFLRSIDGQNQSDFSNEISVLDIADDVYQNVRITTDHRDYAKSFLLNADNKDMIRRYNTRVEGKWTCYLPFFADHKCLVLDYRLNPSCLDQLVLNHEMIKRHAVDLKQLAENIESLNP